MTANTVVALLTRGIKGDNDLISDLEVLDIVTLFCDGSDELVATDEVRRALEMATVEMQIGSLQSGEKENWGWLRKLTQRAVEVTFSTASVGFWILG